MNRWKKPAMAAALSFLILAGTWGGLLVEQRSAQTMGRTEQALPRIRLEQDGGINRRGCGELFRPWVRRSGHCPAACV